ncbi:MAG TPA: FtsQ-type POTRA domain-containing protein [Novosphingobium sp.]|nr:FtsQ-type POTRA domain-containing protein [Novosphingobium sp.]
MSARTIKRGGKGVRRTAAAHSKTRKVQTARARTGSVIDTLMGWLPFSEAQLHRIFLAMILGVIAVGLWFAASLAGVPAMAREQVARFSHDAGFELHNVTVRGTDHLNELKVYQIALADRNRAMPFVDVDALRARLLELSWVQDARVSRQLPDTLVIDIIERKPVAVVQKADRLVLIDPEGRELEVVSAARAKGKLLLKGPGAGRQVQALTALLEAAPALRPQVASAEWVGNRRWNLTFKTGQLLALPEGGDKAAKALVSFAQLDGRNRLLGGKAVAFDMRAPDRIYFRLPGRTDAIEQPRPAANDSARNDAAEKDPAKPAAAAKPSAAKKETP